MFERYTERARRVIFYARFEASQFGSPYIETEHVLLALLREDRFLAKQLFSAGITPDELRKEVESQLPHNRPTSTSVDLPLTNECKRVLAYAAEEAARLQNRNIGAE